MLLKSIEHANKLSKTVGNIPVMTSFIIDTGAGIHLKCYAAGLSMFDIHKISLMSANGPLSASKMTKVKFRNIGEQDCIVLENSPNVLGVGQLVAQGFSFIWTPGDMTTGVVEQARLCTPSGQTISLVVRDFVPYLINGTEPATRGDGLANFIPDRSHDPRHCESEPDCEIDHSALPAVGTRVRIKTKIALSDRQQTALDNAVENLAVAENFSHDLLHFHSHRDCSLCRQVKQRRNYSHPILEENKHLATKVFEKTDIDHIIIGNGVPGLLGETVGLVARDEAIGFVSVSPDTSKLTNAVAIGLRHHFGPALDKAQARGFMLYSDSAAEFQKVAKKLWLIHRAATPNSDEANARHERFMGVFGDLIRTVLFQSGLPLSFWALAAEYAANVYNMTVIPFRKSVTPYSARYPDRKLPNIPHFGSLCTYVPKAIEKKSSRSRQGIFVGYTRLPGGIVTDEYRVVPLSCFTQGLKQVNIVTTRDVRFPNDSPDFQIKTWNTLAESRSYIEKFKPLNGEDYYQHVWNSNNIQNSNPQAIV